MDSEVYFIKASVDDGQQVISEKARRLFEAGGFGDCFKDNDFTAVKIHVGEGGNNTYIKAPYIKGLVDKLIELKTRPFVTDTTTLYVGRRNNAINHTVLAAEHGFNSAELGIPFIVSDGLLGTSETAVKIDGKHNKEVFVARDIAMCQSILSIAHVTGHMASGLGATLKTLGMGCASKKGKLKQHAALKLSIGDKCTLCGECLKHCPVDAISLGRKKASINQDKCIGCAECMAHCRFEAVKWNWGQETAQLQENIAEYALGTLAGKENKAIFFNFLLSVTKDCDCFSTPDMLKIVGDIGIAASRDPVAVDKAALDLLEEMAGRKLQEVLKSKEIDPRCQIEHAERIGLGNSSYELIEIN
ncbi:MAG: DUF362 domain-containing protein [Sedimentisphaerales bacterium]|nr:DUF362 domain-containing protein [Sedimentisphaerales bacterium]